jgi:ADP-ribosylarginine hydrolase
MSKEIEERYIATMLLHALGDTIGFKNGDWEFFPKNTVYGSTLEKLYEFIELGGINNINLKHWNVSDDTILHMSIARSLIMPYNNLDELENNTTKMIIKANDTMQLDKKNNKNRYIGIAVEKHALMLKDGKKWKDFEFDKMGGGNGSAMRNNCIGLAFFGKNNRDKLIEYAINSSKMTHTNPIGWLGGLSTALLTAFILENIEIQKWIPEMLQIMESKNVKKYLNPNNQEEQIAFEEFIQCWKTYYETRFIRGTLVKPKSHSNLIQRLIFYNNIFDVNPMSKMGLSGYAAVIVAYDCLLDAGNNWEKLVIYSMINIFDSDTIGAIAGGLFGTLYGLSNIPPNNLKYIEFKDKLIKIGKLLYKKYYKNEKILL